MTCAWPELLSILPPIMRTDISALGKSSLQELRLRINAPPELVFSDKIQWLTAKTTKADLQFVINAASQYSPWNAGSIADGYLTAPGGHRIGICGEMISKNGIPCGIRDIRSLCIRIARDFSNIGNIAAKNTGSLLILGAPGWGKTTLLRDLIRIISETKTVSVVDERGELFPESFRTGKRMDILTGCQKALGIEIVLRTMGPEYIAVDEITTERDCEVITNAAHCGVYFLATAHASSLSDYYARRIYRQLAEQEIFDYCIVLKQNRTYTVERMS